MSDRRIYRFGGGGWDESLRPGGTRADPSVATPTVRRHNPDPRIGGLRCAKDSAVAGHAVTGH